MITEIAVVLALALGFVLGLGVGARRAFSLVLSQRTMRTTSARFARFMPETAPTRSPADMLAGRVRVLLGGTTFDLPVLPRAASRRWLEQLDARFATLALSLDEAGNDAGQIMGLLLRETDAMCDMLVSYDQSNVLPDRAEIDETATDAQILHAVLEVWRAVNPLVASATPPSAMPGPSLPLPSSPRQPTDGVPTTSSPA